NTEELVSLFNLQCQSVLDQVAPYKYSNSSHNKKPWLNEFTRVLKRDCRRAERKWKKSTFNVFFYLQWKDAMMTYQTAVKEARINYFANLITSNNHNPRILYKVINSITAPSTSVFSDASAET
ncbi:hypothetical protein LDENG_00255100, partial [Lucifuga dentata]